MRVSLVSLALSTSFAAPAYCWGEFGHQITATIAQIYLLPSAREAVQSILPPTFKGRLAGVASWPDYIKVDPKFNNLSEFHFVNVKDDNPPEQCSFTTQEWTSQINILNGIVNRTRLVASRRTEPDERDQALRFLVHFLGDVHQPFHLTGRFRGANRVTVNYNGRSINLHAMWDESLIEDQVVHLTNYTTLLPTTPDSTTSPSQLERNTRAEDVLIGSPYDSYIRWILAEGVDHWWADEIPQWLGCTPPNFAARRSTDDQIAMNTNRQFSADVFSCAYSWAATTHELLCGPDSVWPAKWVGNSKDEANEHPGGYADTVRDRKIVEKQLALGGIRLAAILNTLFATPAERESNTLYPLL